MQWTYCMKLLTCEVLIALSLTVFYLLFLCPLSTRILSDLRLFVICLFPSTEMEERSIHGNNGKVFQSHKLYFWQLPIKWPFNSKATTLRNGRLPQRCYSRVKDKSAGGARIWSHYTSECINEYDTDVLIFFYAYLCRNSRTWSLVSGAVYTWQLWHDLPCHLLARVKSSAATSGVRHFYACKYKFCF